MAGHRHARAWSPAPCRKESITPTLPLLSCPRMSVLFRACLGSGRGQQKREGIILRRARFMHKAQESLARMQSVSTHEEVLLWMRFFRSSRSQPSASLR
jgi:hypothetical protein